MRHGVWAKLSCICCLLSVFILPGAAGASSMGSGKEVGQLLEKAQTLYMQDKLEEALKVTDEAAAHIWSWAPFHIQRLEFTENKTPGYGLYQIRAEGNRFKSGQSIYFYVEPKAYGFRNVSPDVVEFGLALDMYLTSTDGKVLWGKENFLSVTKRSHARNREFFLNITLTLTNVPKGKYGIKLVFRDLVKKQSVDRRVNIEVH